MSGAGAAGRARTRAAIVVALTVIAFGGAAQGALVRARMGSSPDGGPMRAAAVCSVMNGERICSDFGGEGGPPTPAAVPARPPLSATATPQAPAQTAPAGTAPAPAPAQPAPVVAAPAAAPTQSATSRTAQRSATARSAGTTARRTSMRERRAARSERRRRPRYEPDDWYDTGPRYGRVYRYERYPRRNRDDADDVCLRTNLCND